MSNNSQDRAVNGALAELTSPQVDVPRLYRRYRGEDYEDLWRRVRMYQGFAGALISANHLKDGFSLAHEGMLRHEWDAELQYLCGLALARMGVIAKAERRVEELNRVPNLGRELKQKTLSLAGRLQKDRYIRAENSRVRQKKAEEAAKWYEDAYSLCPKVFPAINAATMYLLAGRQKAYELANQVLDLAGAAQHVDYWLLASLGEARIILDQKVEAAKCYRKAVRLCGNRLGDLASMRGNIQLLRGAKGIGDDILDLFHLRTNVVAFAGETADDPSALAAGGRLRFPPSPKLEGLVSAAIRDWLRKVNAMVGYCCPRPGSEVLFAEELLERGGELHAVLPFGRDDFYRVCVNPNRARWFDRCQRVLDRATAVHSATTGGYLGDEVLFDFLNTFLQGLAVISAAERSVEPHALVVLDPAPQPRGRRGACACDRFYRTWTGANRPGEMINLAELRARCPLPSPPPVKIATRGRPAVARASASRAAGAAGEVELKRELKTLLFADVKNYSKAGDGEGPLFFLNFTREVRATIDEFRRDFGRNPDFWNTWGDALFIVFESVRDGAEFATRLVDRMERVPWKTWGLPHDTTVRVGMHVGPVYRNKKDALLRRRNYFGTHVNRAARIEPVTPPGCVFVSEQFAAALAAEPTSDFVCVMVGLERLAKDYDTCPLYNLDRKLPGA